MLLPNDLYMLLVLINSFSLGAVLQWASNLWDKVFKHFHVSFLDFNMQQAKSELFSL